jgi:23S rRNA (pseudouridine1915-N3)-methyltransferase
MKLTIAAVGRLKDGGERVLVDRYVSRLAGARGGALGPVLERELPESRAGTATERRDDEARRLLAAVAGCDVIVALDERGRDFNSQDFARWLGTRQDAGARHAAFLIGGPDGHGAEVLAAAALQLCLGRLTLPHGLARAVLAEQLYRAATILAGHPYHRA